ncbi:hypothetical protein [Klebsiella michiganensis]|uniref:hypothetical protein n=1 Tax=Klebsiella michiganensis TaxID=1134687 RepID=UPI000665F813|nr:hypothetical protein [Klebsiella michiganensis]
MAASSIKDLPLAASEATRICAQLWQSGGVKAKQAEELFAVLPGLQILMQPVSEVAGTVEPQAYCLTAPLIDAYNELSRLGEWQLALLGLNPDYRNHWLNLAAARCSEAGCMSNPLVLVRLIGQLEQASEWILPLLQDNPETPTLAAGPLASQERELIGHSLNDNAAIPALCRILRVCFTLDAFASVNTSTPLLTPGAIATVDLTGRALERNWCAGRVLALPDVHLFESLLELKPQSNWLLTERPVVSGLSDYIELFSYQPWLYLLSLLIFVQDAWAAEQRGGLLFSLPAGQNAFAPMEISVVLQGRDGDEVNLGSLGVFLLQMMDKLRIPLYPRTPDIAAFNLALSPLIASLLSQQLWQFKEGGRGESGFYHIHPDFCDSCYSLPLAPLFSYKSTHLQQVIKQCAQSARGVNPAIIQGSSL